MRSLLSLFALSLLAAVPVFAADPVVTLISPAAGSSSGGTRVLIFGNHLAAQVQCIVPCPTEVTFGGVTVAAIEESEGRLLVIAPAHEPGVVDVTVAPAGANSLTLPNAFVFVTGQEEAYERILLPIYTDAPVSGAHGTLWRTDFWLRNSSNSKSAGIAPWPCNTICPPVYPLANPLHPDTAMHNLPPGFAPGVTPSRIVYVTRNGAELAASLRVADVSRADLNAGTEIPVIREAELLSGPIDLVNVPYDPSKFRLMLRIYDLYATTAQYRVTLYGQGETFTPLEYDVMLTAQSPQTGDFRTEAAYVQFDFAPLGEVDKVWPSAFRIHIQPLDSSSRYWAFVSITNNDTQLITLATPQ